MVRSAPRCSYCGEALQAGALSWSEVERESAARQARERTAPEIVKVDIGLDAAGRAAAYAQLKKSFFRSADRVELIELFVRGLGNDFSSEQAEASPACVCARLAETMVCVNWSARVDAGVEFDGWSAALLVFGVLTYKRQWVDYHVATYHAACSMCAKKKGWFDRYERFVGKVPNLLRVGKVERLPLTTGARGESGRGADLRYDLTITNAEEIGGFTRTMHFQRQTETTEASRTTATTADASHEIAMGPGWAAGHLRRNQGGFHYALRLRGHGNRGFPAGNNGDLFVTVTVQD